MIRSLIDGLLLICPRCHRGRMFAHGFTMHQRCPVCNLRFEHASGEVTGGMGINIALTLLVIIGAALVFGLQPSVPLLPLLLALSAFAIIFPIAFYRSSRGLWASVLYITGDNDEGDSELHNRER